MDLNISSLTETNLLESGDNGNIEENNQNNIQLDIHLSDGEIFKHCLLK